MAYLRELVVKCRRCPKKAVVEVFNWRNASHGEFCRYHGKQVLEALARAEQRGEE